MRIRNVSITTTKNVVMVWALYHYLCPSDDVLKYVFVLKYFDSFDGPGIGNIQRS